MPVYQFKTNINCDNCIRSVEPFLNQNLDIERWEVDTLHPDKILTVETGELLPDEIQQTVVQAGFKAEVLA